MTAVKFSFARVSLNESPLMRKLHLFQSARCLYNKLDQSLCSVKNKQTKKTRRAPHAKNHLILLCIMPSNGLL